MLLGENMAILDGVNLSSDIKELNNAELVQLAGELRGCIISTVKENGGHLSSNLGIVETTLAVHKVFDFPKDKLIFDVGHQCYAHKLITGRKDRFNTIRTNGGLSGFPDMQESEYDAFSTGHAGTSVATAIGYCNARDKQGQDYCVVDIVGDGSFANGLNLEAVGATSVKPKNLIIILNDNGMSISKNHNGIYKSISKNSLKKGYIKSKRAFKKVFRNSFITKGFKKFREFIKRIFNKNNYFEQLGFKYVGLVDGNNLEEMVSILENVKEFAKTKAVLVHIKTTKGKGFDQAEEQADVYHGVGKDLRSKESLFSKRLGQELNALIEEDNKIVAVTAGMSDGTGLKTVMENYPDNFIDVGIAEEYAVTLSAGMASGGLKPVVAIYSTFLQRAYDEILHDVCLPNLPVIFCVDRAGLVGADGKTHQGVFDLSYLSHLPNITIFAPNDTEEFANTLRYALTLSSPVAIRYPSTGVQTVYPYQPIIEAPWQTLSEGREAVILAVGPRMVDIAVKVKEKANVDVKVISARQVKPLDKKVLDGISDLPIITLEENSIIGGFGYAVLGYYAEKGINVKIKNLGIKDSFVEHGTVEKQLIENGLTVEDVLSTLQVLTEKTYDKKI